MKPSVLAKTALIILPFLFCNLTLAGKLYKIVDANGNVTYSQFPPASSDQSQVNSVKTVGTSSPQLSVRTRGNNAYCGDISLPTYYKKRGQLEELQRRKETWEEQLRYAEEHVQNRTQYDNEVNQRYIGESRANDYLQRRNENSYKYNQRALERIKALRCAINWVENNETEVADKQVNDSKELARLRTVSDNLKESMQLTCGEKPVYDPSDKGYHAAAREWRKCSNKYNADLRRTEREMRKLERGY